MRASRFEDGWIIVDNDGDPVNNIVYQTMETTLKVMNDMNTFSDEPKAPPLPTRNVIGERPPMPAPNTPFASHVDFVCHEIAALLKDKNRKYGDSALNPKRIFSKANSIEQINVRIDDKLSRIATSDSAEDEDVELDLIGYLILKRIAKRSAS